MMAKEELSLRYSRQMAIPEIGIEGQEKLRNSKVLIIGCGALGSMAAMQLAGAGVGTIGIADFDTIEISNLQRQFFFKTKEAGNFKSKILSRRINELNPEINLIEFPFLITKKNAEEIFREFDFIIDATDNPASKMLIGQVCEILGKPCCIGGIRDFSGQVITFEANDSRFEEFFGEVNNDGFLPCSLSGVVGPAAAFCASVQSAEAIKNIIGIGDSLSGKILSFNLLDCKFRIFEI